MKHKIYILFILAFLLFATSIITVNASAGNTASINKTIKVNSTYKLNKALKIKKSALKDFTFKTSSKSVASVSSSGIVTGIKAGSAKIEVISKYNNSLYATINIKVKNRYSKSELRLMSSIIYSEAGSECYAGKKAVGIVVMNRIKSSSFPNSLSGVIYQSGQFTPAINGSLSRSLSLYDNKKLNKSCIKAAKEALNGSTAVEYNNKSYSMNGYLFFSRYVSGARLQIQHHQFK